MVSTLIIPHQLLTDDLGLYVARITDVFPSTLSGERIPQGRQPGLPVAVINGQTIALYPIECFRASALVRVQIENFMGGGSSQLYTSQQFEEFRERYGVEHPQDLVGMAVVSAYYSGMLVGLMPVKHSI